MHTDNIEELEPNVHVQQLCSYVLSLGQCSAAMDQHCPFG